jgi:hypothetical protein
MPGPRISIERDLLKSEAFRGLNGTAKTVYFDFRMKCKVQWPKRKPGRGQELDILNNGELVYTYAEAENKKPPIGRASFMRALDTLIERGIIDVAHSGSGGKKGDKSLYAISERWRAYGTDEFKPATRPKDRRQGRGFKVYWEQKK